MPGGGSLVGPVEAGGAGVGADAVGVGVVGGRGRPASALVLAASLTALPSTPGTPSDAPVASALTVAPKLDLLGLFASFAPRSGKVNGVAASTTVATACWAGAGSTPDGAGGSGAGGGQGQAQPGLGDEARAASGREPRSLTASSSSTSASAAARPVRRAVAGRTPFSVEKPSARRRASAGLTTGAGPLEASPEVLDEGDAASRNRTERGLRSGGLRGLDRRGGEQASRPRHRRSGS